MEKNVHHGDVFLSIGSQDTNELPHLEKIFDDVYVSDVLLHA